MKTILLTGSSGFIGRRLNDFLIIEGYNIKYLIREESNYRVDNNNVNTNIIYENQLDEVLSYKIDFIIHLAWGGSRRGFRDNIDINEKNYSLTMKLAQFAIKNDIRRFIGFGSQAEYGNIQKVDDNTFFNPSSEYGKYKLKTKDELNSIFEKTNIHFVWLRLFSIYGPNDNQNTLIISTLGKMLRNDSIDLTSCIQLWDFLHIDDLCELIIKVIKSDMKGEYNVAFGVSKPLKEYIEIMRNITGTKSLLNFGSISYGSEGVVNLNVDVRKLKHDFNWKPVIDFNQGIIGIVEELKRTSYNK